MALTFGGATTDRIDGTAVLGLGSTFTILQWLYPTALTNLRTMLNQPLIAGTKKLSIAGTIGNVELRVRRLTTACIYISSSTPLSTLNKWYYIAATYSEGASAGTLIHMYVGDLATLASEVTYGTQTDGSGATNAESVAYLIGNETTAAAVAFQGRIGFTAAYNRVLTLSEIQSLQFRLRPVSGCRLFMLPGYNGTGTQTDYSGNANHGTVTGATVADHVPIPFRRRGPLYVPYTVAAGAASAGRLIGGKLVNTGLLNAGRLVA